jgi:DNA-binding beta-propeller fold protein YncE
MPRFRLIACLAVCTAALAANGGAAPRPLPVIGKVVAAVSVGSGAAPMGLVAVPGGVWVAAHHKDSIYRIDGSSHAIVASVAVAHDDQPGRMVVGGGALFAEDYSGTTVSVLDPATGTVSKTITARFENCCWPAYGAGSLWLVGFSSSAAQSPDRLSRIDPTSGTAIKTWNLRFAQGIAFGAGSVWGTSNGKVFRLDASTNRITAQIRSDMSPTAFAAGAVWGLSQDGLNVVRISPATNRVVAAIRLPSAGAVLTASGTGVWVTQGPADNPGSHLWKIDVRTNRVVGQVRLGRWGMLDDVAVGDDGSVWVSLFDADRVLHVRLGR